MNRIGFVDASPTGTITIATIKRSAHFRICARKERNFVKSREEEEENGKKRGKNPK